MLSLVAGNHAITATKLIIICTNYQLLLLLLMINLLLVVFSCSNCPWIQPIICGSYSSTHSPDVVNGFESSCIQIVCLGDVQFASIARCNHSCNVFHAQCILREMLSKEKVDTSSLKCIFSVRVRTVSLLDILHESCK